MGKDIYIDDFEAELLVSDTSFKPPKDKEEDEKLNVKQIYHRYSGKFPTCSKNLSIYFFSYYFRGILLQRFCFFFLEASQNFKYFKWIWIGALLYINLEELG